MSTNRNRCDINKAASILISAQPEISAIKKKISADAIGRRREPSETPEQRAARLRDTKSACDAVATFCGEAALTYHASEIRSIVEHRGLRVRMVDGLAVVYRGA